MKVEIYTANPMMTFIRTKEECVRFFDEEYYDKFGIEIPDELALQLIEATKRLRELSLEVAKYDKYR